MDNPSSLRVALLAGATGAVGKVLLRDLLDNPHYSEIRVLTRKPLGFSHPRLRELPCPAPDQNPEALLGNALVVDDFYCCLGSTQRAAGSKVGFEAVDYHLVVQLARAARGAGAAQMLVVSAVGSTASSPSFYSRVKARTEAALEAEHFPCLHIFQPSLLIAERDDHRPAEAIAQKLAPLFNPLLRGPLARYQAVTAASVARAMHRIAQQRQPGVHRHWGPY